MVSIRRRSISTVSTLRRSSDLQHAGDWEATAEILCDGARRIDYAGADFLLICTNTMHKVASEMEAALSIPLVHIVDATAEALDRQGVKRVGLLGTKFTMAEQFYKGRLEEKFGVDVVVPKSADQDWVHNVIYQELCCGTVDERSRKEFLSIINGLGNEGAEGIILGCTEIALLVQQSHTVVPLFDTTALHAAKAVELALAE